MNNLKKAGKSIFKIILMVLAASLMFSCNTNRKQESLVAFTSIIPHKYFVKRIAGNRFKVYALVERGRNPHNFSPVPAQITKLSRAQVFFRTGIDFEEKIISKIRDMNKNLEIVDLRTGIQLRDMKEENHGHYHVKKDIHTWLSPVLAKKQAETILNALIAVDPKGKHIYETNYKLFTKDLDSLDAYLRHTLEEFKGRELFVFHPAFGYFAKEYGLKQIAIEVEGKEPSAKALTGLIDKMKKQKVKVIFTQARQSQKSTLAIADQIGCTVISVDHLPGNYLADMKTLGEKIKKGLSM